MTGSRWSIVFLMAVLVAVALDAGAPDLVTYRWLPVGAALGASLSLGFLRSRRTLQALVPLWVFLLVMAVYALNPTHHWTDGVGLLPADPVPLLPGSAYAPGTWSAFALAVSAVAVFALGLCVSVEDTRWMQWGILLGGVAMALAVLHQRLLPHRSALFSHTGTFANENHFAAFANLLIPVILVTGTRFQYRAAQEGSPSSPAGIFFLGAGLLMAAVLMTGSRMGGALMAVALMAWAFLQWRLQRVYGFLRPGTAIRKLWAPAFIALAALGLLAIGFTREWLSGSVWRREFGFRGQLLADTVKVWLAHPWWGTGPGTFSIVFPYYQSAELAGHQVTHAHCEPLQYLAEFGVLGGVLGLCAVAVSLLALRRCACSCGSSFPSFGELEAWGFGIGLITVFLHSLVDFPFRMPVILFLSAVWVSQLCRCGLGCQGRAHAGVHGSGALADAGADLADGGRSDHG